MTSVAFFTLAYLAYLAKTRTWVLSRYLRAVRRDPFGVGSDRQLQQSEIAARPELCRVVMDELRAGVIPLVEGPAGAGKTTFIYSLAKALADRGAVPVPVSLRGLRPPFDVREVARLSFHRRIEPWVSTEGEADRLWRQLYRGGHIVVLADALDEAVDDYPLTDMLRSDEHVTRGSRGGLAIVVASRPRPSVARERFSPFPLPPLEREWLVDHAIAGAPESVTRRAVEDLIVALDAARTPFYYDIAKTLLSASGSAQPIDLGLGGSTDAVRWRSLDRYLGSEKEFAQSTVAPLATRVGAQMVEAGTSAITTADARELLGAPPDVVDRELAELRRRGLVRVGIAGDAETISFAHPIFAAFLASVAWSRDKHTSNAPWLADGRLGRPSEELLLATRMYCAARPIDPAERRGVIQALVDRSEASAAASDRMQLLGTAAHAASSGNRDDAVVVLDALAADGVLEHSAVQSDPSAALVLVDGLADLARCHPDDNAYKGAYETLWRLVSMDVPYAVSWRVVEALVTDPRRGIQAVGLHISDHIADVGTALNAMPAKDAEMTDADDERRRQPVEALLPPLSAIAKFLPGAVTSLPADTPVEVRAATERLLQSLVRLVRSMRDKSIGAGVEASLAQGFKLAAARTTAPGIAALDGLVDDRPMLETELAGSFWYARMNIIHALLWRGLGLAQTEGTTARNRRREIRRVLLRATRDGHPFVRKTARLALEGLVVGRWRPQRVRRLVWGDEAATAQHSGAELGPGAARLLGKVLLVLNMNEQRWPAPANPSERRRTMNTRVARGDAVPACLSSREDSSRLTDEDRSDPCSSACGFRLCPYSPARATGSAYRDLSAPFCERQAALERRWRRRVVSRLTGRENLASAWSAIAKSTLERIRVI